MYIGVDLEHTEVLERFAIGDCITAAKVLDVYWIDGENWETISGADHFIICDIKSITTKTMHMSGRKCWIWTLDLEEGSFAHMVGPE